MRARIKHLRRFFDGPTLSRTLLLSSLPVALQLPVLPLTAQQFPAPPAISVSGDGPETYVLLSGMVGGVATWWRTTALLVGCGFRVIAIDPYLLSIDSADMSFAALARRVDRELGARAVRSAVVVGHSHGGGVALRLAAQAPDRVESLFLLDVGALPTQRSAVFSSAIRLVPIIARIPAGRSFIRDRFIRGLRENSGTDAWLDEATQRAYTEPMLNDIDRVVAMAMRLAEAREPEPIATLLPRIRVPVTVLAGDVTNPSEPEEGELRALEAISGPLRVEDLAGVGHFPHEESAAEVVRRLVAPRTMTVVRSSPSVRRLP